MRTSHVAIINALRLSVIAALLAVSLSALIPPRVAHAATITVDVDITTDSNALAQQQCTAAPGDCSLRGAISKANANTANDYVINLAGLTYTLSLAGVDEDNNATGDLDVTTTASLTLIGQGAAATTIDAAQIDRVLHVRGRANVTLRALTLTNGRTRDGDLAFDGDGGGVYNSGMLTIEQSVIRGNAAGDGAACAGDSCSAGYGGEGGGVYCAYDDAGALTLRDSTVSDNVAGNGGACTGEECEPGGGGYGGGVLSYGGPVTIERSTIRGNTAGDGGACTGYDCTGGYGGYGGGVCTVNDSGGSLAMTASTVSGNRTGDGGTCHGDACRGGDGGGAGGARVASGDGAALTNVTISGNCTGNGGACTGVACDKGDGGSDGGLEHCDAGTLTLAHCTITGNTAGSYGGIGEYNGVLNLKNTIVAGNDELSGGGNDDCYLSSDDSSLVSQGYNLVGAGTGCPSDGTGDQTTGDAKLLALADNGGPTQTHALGDGSPATDRIPPGTNGCGTDYTVDQRGETRPVNFTGAAEATCDVGAFERQLAPPPPPTPVPTLSEWGLLILAGLVAGYGAWALRRRALAR